MKKPKILLMPDWEAFPVWGLEWPNQLSEDLCQDLVAWRECWEELADERDNGHGNEDKPAWAEMAAQGLRLRTRLATELGIDESEIEYRTFS